MRECENVELQGLLPGMMDGEEAALTEHERARVTAHLATCDACRKELELLRMARQAMLASTPVVNVARIVSALPSPPGRRVQATPSRRVRSRRVSWAGWQMAAVVSTIAVGGLSLALFPKTFHETPSVVASVDSGPLVGTTPTSVLSSSSSKGQSTPMTAPRATPTATPTTAIPTHVKAPPAKGAAQSEEGLGVGGGLSDLDEGDLKSVLNSLDSLDARPSAEVESASPGLHRASSDLGVSE